MRVEHVVVTVGLALLAPSASAQLSTGSTFIITGEQDTVAVERFTRTSTALIGDLRLVQQPQSLHVHYTVSFRPDGSPTRVEIIDDAPNFFTGTVVFDAKSMMAVQAEIGALNDRVRMSPANTQPAIGTSMALMEQLVRATHPAIGDSARIGVMNIRNGNTSAMTITRTSTDSVSIVCDGCMRMGVREEIRVALGKSGDIVGGTNPSLHWTITRR